MGVNGVLELNLDLPDVEYAEVELPNGEKMYLLWEEGDEGDKLPAKPPEPLLRPSEKVREELGMSSWYWGDEFSFSPGL